MILQVFLFDKSLQALLPNHSDAVLYLFYCCIKILQCVNKIFNLPIQTLCLKLHHKVFIYYLT